jgi:hypothetical protein
MDGQFGSIFSTNPHRNNLNQYDATHAMHPNFVKFPNSLKSIGLLTSLLGSKPFFVFMMEMISFGIKICLVPLVLTCLVTLMATALSFFFFRRYGVVDIFIHLVCVGVRELDCFPFVFSLIIHLALIGLMSFLMA